jgi:hypothetical protein
MRRKIGRLAILVWVATLGMVAACSTGPVTHLSPNVDFADYRTYSWRVDAVAFEEIRGPVDAALAERGLTQSLRDPDLLMVEKLWVAQRVSTTSYSIEAFPVARVQLVAFDRVLGDTVWAAMSSDIRRPDKGGPHVEKAVRRLIATFPR